MVKRFKKMADEVVGSTTEAAGKALEGNMVSAVKDSAQQIWLAGLGAFAKTQVEGTKVFDVLVKEGMALQKRTVKLTEAKMNAVTGKVTAATGDLTKTATGTWDKLESVFEERVARSLNRLGVPTNKDIQALTKRVEELTVALHGMGAVRKPATVRKVAAKVIKPAKKALAATKKAVARKAK